jgi:hypothetical protein
MVNFLLIGKIVIPYNMGLYNWMEFYELADYFCIDRLKLICEQQLRYLVTEYNCDEIMNFSMEMGIDSLSLFCSDFIIRYMLGKDDQSHCNSPSH